MTSEEKKAFLELFYDIATDIKLLYEEADFLRESMLPSGIHISDMPKAHSQSDPMADFGARLDALERERRFLIRGMQNIRDSIRKTQKSSQRMILNYRYIKDYSWSEIAKKMAISERHAKRIGGKAIDALEIAEPKNATAILNYYREKGISKFAKSEYIRTRKRNG